MGLGPTMFRGLKEIDTNEGKCDELAERLREKGAKFRGDTPTASVISKAKATTEKRKMLEGLDTSLIMDSPVRGGGRRGRNKVQVSYAESNSEEEGSDGEEEEFELE